jgi:tRNA modification GTPase
MDLSLDDTIAALASAPGAARRGIVRISGPDIRPVLADCFQPDDQDAWNTATAAFAFSGVIKSLSSRAPIRVDAYLWPNRRSYTGQSLVELHLDGSPPLLEAVLSHLYRHGARPARPGEFTLRAFLAGKLDLLQAEAVLGVIDAHDHAELETALSQLAGGLSGQLSELRRDLLELLADLEAGLDFIEEDISFIGRCELQGRIALASRFVDDLLQQSSGRMQTNSRPRVVLAGLPNAGKSTLFNCLVDTATALVSDQEGTTRDFLVGSVDWDGLQCELIDTAGWDASTTAIEEAAQQKRDEQFQQADLVVWCSAANLDRTQQQLDEELFDQARRQVRSVLRVLTQTDRVHGTSWLTNVEDVSSSPDIAAAENLEISAATGCGLDELVAAIRNRLTLVRGSGRHWLGMTAARCRESLEGVACSLEHAEASAASELVGDELIAVDIREALDHLGHILGTLYTDDILDRVFSKFCIGK